MKKKQTIYTITSFTKKNKYTTKKIIIQDKQNCDPL